MLMDEPFAGLDAPTRLSLQQALLELWESHRKTVVFVTHDIDEALLLSDRVLVLDGPPATVVDAVNVPFARPRAPGLALEDAFLALKRRIWAKLRQPAAGRS
jgi:ABC-type nitrate/sulfonate/bicarbonate transport system ATPase subunit